MTAAVAVVAPALALAQQTPPQPTPGEVRQGVIQACGTQINQFCGTVQMGGGRLVRCLKSNFQQLTPQCKGHLAEAYAIREEEQP
jgi:hypothetical protein